jgi:RNA polymerase sigma-70 factor (ECF subfamily)
LPEPVATERSPAEATELSESLTLGFLTLLDKLTPIERAVFLLADVFSVPFAEIAGTVGKSEAACRQIASRARRRVRSGPTRQRAGGDRRVVDELLVALALGDVDTVLARLAPDVVLVSDGGAARRAARRPVVGADRVLRFLGNLARRNVPSSVWPATINGEPGVVVEIDGAVDFVVAFDVVDDRVSAVWIIRNPAKLRHVRDPVALS